MKQPSLAIVERAWRGTIEEQYAHILWLSHMIRRLRGEIDVLLRGNAVRYAVAGQPRTELRIGNAVLDGLPHFESEIAAMVSAGIFVYVSAQDCACLGIELPSLIPAVTAVDEAGICRLFDEHVHIWHW